jgi:sulfotransferase family protein
MRAADVQMLRPKIMRKPNFFILGAPKCGTTSLWSWLREHPDVFMSEMKEPSFFNYGDRLGISNLSDYEELFRDAIDSHAAVGEASVFYLSSPDAVQNILQYQPEACFIVLVRNPIEMAVALHLEMLISGYENTPSFRTAWHLQGERRLGRRIPAFGGPHRCFLYGDLCSLGAQLERLLAVTKGDRVLTVVLDDIQDNPRREYLKILTFLGVIDDGRVNFQVENAARVLRRPWLARSQFITTQVKKKLHIDVGPGLLRSIYSRNVIVAERPGLDQNTYNVLREYFTRDVDLLGGLIGRNLRHWMDMSTPREPVRELNESLEMFVNQAKTT